MHARWLYCIREANLNLDKPLYAVMLFAEAMGIVEKLTGVNPIYQHTMWREGVDKER